MKHHFIVIAAAACAFLASTSASLAANLVQNGNFEQSTNGAGQFSSYAAQTVVADWNTRAYASIFTSGSADTTGAYSPEFGFYLTLWGPAYGVNNGLTATSPDGGNFVGNDANYADGQYDVTAPIEQTINGLTPGQSYNVGFYYAYGVQYGHVRATTQQWSVSLGSETQSLPVYDLPKYSFSGWSHADLVFTATAVSEVLGFTASGGPTGSPPFALLDGVTMNAVSVPEPTAWTMMIVGLGLLGGFARRRLSLAQSVAI